MEHSGALAHDATTVDFHFDVMCPFAYQTSIWMRSAADDADRDHLS